MNSREWDILQKLVSDLDDTRLLYMEFGPLLVGARLIYLVELIALLHEEIAEDLARQMSAAGRRTPHRGESASGKLHRYLEPLLVITGVNVDLSCLNAVARHETRVVQRFVMTLDEVEGLPQGLYREQRHLAHALSRIESLMQEMEASASTFARNARTMAPVKSTRGHRL